MQPFETLTLVLFLLQYLYTAVRSIATPDQYRAAEVAFYKTGKASVPDAVMMAGGAASFLTFLGHLMFEAPYPGQLLLYGQVVMFAVVLPLHFLAITQKRMSKTLGAKSNSDYRNSGYKKIAIAVVMVALPVIFHR